MEVHLWMHSKVGRELFNNFHRISECRPCNLAPQIRSQLFHELVCPKGSLSWIIILYVDLKAPRQRGSPNQYFMLHIKNGSIKDVISNLGWE